MATTFALPSPASRASPGAQLNWITETYEFPAIEPEQLEWAFPPAVEEENPVSEYVSLLATENGAQLFVSGFGVSLGKKSERVVVKHKGKACAEVPFLKLQEIVVGSRGVSLSTDLLDAACERGVRVAFLTASGKPYALFGPTGVRWEEVSPTEWIGRLRCPHRAYVLTTCRCRAASCPRVATAAVRRAGRP